MLSFAAFPATVISTACFNPAAPAARPVPTPPEETGARQDEAEIVRRALRERLDREDPEFATLRRRARIALLRRQATELRRRADEILRFADTLERTDIR